MRACKFLVYILLGYMLAIPMPAQEPATELEPVEENPKITIKVDEFGRVGDCDLSARIDNFFIQLNNRPDAKGYIITYNSTTALPSEYENNRMAARIRQQFAFSRYDASRVTFVDGGFREQMATELFLVPVGGTAPVPSEQVAKPPEPKDTHLWTRAALITLSEEGFEQDLIDEFTLPEVKRKREEEQRLQELEWEIEAAKENYTGGYEPNLEVIDEQEQEEPYQDNRTAAEIYDERFSWANAKYASEIAKRQGAQGVIIFYADDLEFDIKKLKKFVTEGRDKIAKEAKLKPMSLKIVYGGYRHMPEAEFFIVPKNGKSPSPTPEERDPEQEQ